MANSIGKQVTQDLGLVAAMQPGVDPPQNKKLIWYNENDGLHYYYDRTLDSWELLKNSSGEGGGGGTVVAARTTRTIPVSLTGNKTWGTIKDGDIIAKDTPYQDLFERALIEAKLPTYAIAQLVLTCSVPGSGEIGELLNPILKTTFSKGEAGNLTSLRIEKDQVTMGVAETTNPLSRTEQIVRKLIPTTYISFANYGAGPVKPVQPANTPDTRAPKIRDSNAPQAAENNFASNAIQLGGIFPWFYGSSSTDAPPVIYSTGTKIIEPSGGSLSVPSFGAGAKFLWFAVPKGANGSSQKTFTTWFRTALDSGAIGNSTTLFRAAVTISVTSSGLGQNWTKDYDLYFTNYKTEAGIATTLN